MRNYISTVLTLMAIGATSAHAAQVVLTFEGLKNDEAVNTYYDGGTGSLGSGPGPNYGITFAHSLALTSGSYSNEPTAPTILFFLAGSDLMDVANGFDTGFSFYYAAAQPGSVTVYDGLDGTGNVLATLSLPATPSPYSQWEAIGVSFSGTAESVVFGGAANFIGFDNITLGTNTPGSGVAPEPGTLMSALTAVSLFLGLAFLKSRHSVGNRGV